MGSVQTEDWSESVDWEVSGTVRGLVFGYVTAELPWGFTAITLRPNKPE